MKKHVGVILLVVALAMPAGAQNAGFLAKLMKAVVEEFGIESVIAVLGDLGYIGEGEVAVQDSPIVPDNLTVNHEIWELPDDEMADVLISLMSDPGDEMCWNYVNLGTSDVFTATQRMGYRARFVQECVNQ